MVITIDEAASADPYSTLGIYQITSFRPFIEKMSSIFSGPPQLNFKANPLASRSMNPAPKRYLALVGSFANSDLGFPVRPELSQRTGATPKSLVAQAITCV